jgi:hypothetical protein
MESRNSVPLCGLLQDKLLVQISFEILYFSGRSEVIIYRRYIVLLVHSAHHA